MPKWAERWSVPTDEGMKSGIFYFRDAMLVPIS